MNHQHMETEVAHLLLWLLQGVPYLTPPPKISSPDSQGCPSVVWAPVPTSTTRVAIATGAHNDNHNHTELDNDDGIPFHQCHII